MLFRWVVFIIVSCLLVGDAHACMNKSYDGSGVCADLGISAEITYKCPNGEYIGVNECGNMDYNQCCTAYGFNDIEPSAGLEATPLEPIDMQSQWLEDGDNLE